MINQFVIEKANNADKSKWVERKQRMGLIRRDLTKYLLKTPNGMPVVKAYKGDFPSKLIGLTEIKRADNVDAWVHCFAEDLYLERIWNCPEKFFSIIQGYGGMFSLDFSVWLDMADAEKRINIFRNHANAQIAQGIGIPTIATLSWAGVDTFEYAFDGIEGEGIYAVSNIGANRDYVSRKIFRMGLYAATKKLNPKGLIFYGMEFPYKVDCEVRWYANPNIGRLRKISKMRH